MNRLFLTAAAILLSGQAFGASVSVFGHVDISGLPVPPVLVVPTPVVVQPGPTVVEREPVYMHVPPEHRRHWKHYCHQYGACGERVLFVQDNWYHDVYVPHREHYEHHDEGRGPDHDHWDHGHGPDHHDHDHGPDHDHHDHGHH